MEAAKSTVNRNYKDSLFTHLFGNDSQKLVELYNAVSGSSYAPDTKVEITTLEDVLYAGLKNDISFELDGRYVILAEHQSTINENMPVRLLIYAARVYERLLSSENLYRRKLVKIPAPEFIVLYNGQEDFPAEKEYRLSDAYLADPAGNSMELCVRVININPDKGREVLERSNTLAGYSEFVRQVRENQASGQPLEEAVKNAIGQCIQKGVLKEFLEKNGSEVRNMVLTEWDENEAKRIAAEEGREEGRQEGRQLGQRERAKEIALKMLRRGMPIPDILDLAEVSKEDLETWKREQN